MRVPLRISLVITALASATMAPAAVLYSITDLGALSTAAVSADQSEGNAINAAGQVVGDSINQDYNSHAARFGGGAAQDLGTLGGPTSTALGINDTGAITGVSDVGSSRHAFLYSGGALTDLGTVTGGYSYGAAINNAGQVAGWSTVNNTNHVHAVVFAGGGITDLGTLGGADSFGTSINNAGQVAGYSSLSGALMERGFLYSGGAMTNIGTLGGSFSEADALNASGEVTGGSSLAGNSATHAFIYKHGVMTDLGTLPGAVDSNGNGINDLGQVVGDFGGRGVRRENAFLYDGAKLINLDDVIDPSLGWKLEIATAINNAGQITGAGLRGGVEHAFLLTPLAAVPEPASWALMVVGFGLIGAIKRRQAAVKPAPTPTIS